MYIIYTNTRARAHTHTIYIYNFCVCVKFAHTVYENRRLGEEKKNLNTIYLTYLLFLYPAYYIDRNRDE